MYEVVKLESQDLDNCRAGGLGKSRELGKR